MLMRPMVDEWGLPAPAVSVEAAVAAAEQLGRAGGAAHEAVEHMATVIAPFQLYIETAYLM